MIGSNQSLNAIQPREADVNFQLQCSAAFHWPHSLSERKGEYVCMYVYVYVYVYMYMYMYMYVCMYMYIQLMPYKDITSEIKQLPQAPIV